MCYVLCVCVPSIVVSALGVLIVLVVQVIALVVQPVQMQEHVAVLQLVSTQ
jgi:hypothetical protein